MDIKTMNVLVLAYLGDAYFEVMVREFLVFDLKIEKVNLLQKRATQIVSAKGQAIIMAELLESNQLTQDELLIFKRGRNAKIKTFKKDIASYHTATGLEVLIGYLKLTNQDERIKTLFKIMSKVEMN